MTCVLFIILELNPRGFPRVCDGVGKNGWVLRWFASGYERSGVLNDLLAAAGQKTFSSTTLAAFRAAQPDAGKGKRVGERQR